nr:probable protein phosphatase 2C 51 isoform X1 [Quercus suber]
MNLQSTTSDSGEMSQITVTRRRIKVRRLKYTCRTKKTSSSSEEEDVGDSVKVSLSVSSSEKDEVVLSYGSVSVIGRRREMEVAVRAELGIMNKKGGGVGGKYDFFGGYDGHGGCHVARACSERLHGILVEEGESSSEELEGLSEYWERVMEGCFGKMDEEVVGGGGGGVGRTVGSTAVVAVVGGEELVVANCGDCRAVLFSGGVALALSRDHKVPPDLHWCPPEQFQYKANFDGAVFKSSNSAGLGAVICDNKGAVIGALSMHVPFPQSVAEVEAMA